MTRTRNRKDGSIGGIGGGVGGTIAGDSTYVIDVAELPQERVIQLSRSNQLFLINGIYEYCDALGTYSCQQFQMFYQGIPYNRFSLAGENECPVFLTMIAKPDPNLEYLFPCKTFSEREQEHKAHK